MAKIHPTKKTQVPHFRSRPLRHRQIMGPSFVLLLALDGFREWDKWWKKSRSEAEFNTKKGSECVKLSSFFMFLLFDPSLTQIEIWCTCSNKNTPAVTKLWGQEHEFPVQNAWGETKKNWKPKAVCSTLFGTCKAKSSPFQHTYSALLLMEEILHQLIGRLSHYLQCFLHPTGGSLEFLNPQQY